MKARVYQPRPRGLYWGQVYDEYTKRWKNVTLSCVTEWEATRKLEKYLKQNHPREFED